MPEGGVRNCLEEASERPQSCKSSEKERISECVLERMPQLGSTTSLAGVSKQARL